MRWVVKITSLCLWSAGMLRCACGVESERIDYQTHIAPIFTKYCSGCHNDTDLEGGLSLESFAMLQEGGAEGPAVLPGQSESSRMIRVLTGAARPKMPPDDNLPPTAEEIDLLQAWIDAGAKGPEGEELVPVLVTPYVPTKEDVCEPITSLALSHDGTRLAVGKFRRVEILKGIARELVITLNDLPGKVNSVSFSADGTRVIVATGVAGLRGTALILDAATGEKLAEFSGHRDVLYDAVLSPDGTQLATCSYDHQIILWDTATGEERLILSGHNGAVFDLAFSPEGTVLASASADETIKLWRVRDGERLDTLSQPQGEQYAVAFSPDGELVVGGGADNRIRVWQFVSRDEPKINPLLFARIAHEGAIVDLAFSGDGKTLVSAAEDRTLKAWQTARFTETKLYEPQADVAASLAVSPSGRSVVVGLMDGTWRTYAVPAPTEGETLVTAAINTAPSLQNGDADGPQGEADGEDLGPMNKLAEVEPNNAPAEAMALDLPARVAGVIGANEAGDGEDDFYRFKSAGGQEWMIEINASRDKSPLDSLIEVLDADGEPIERVLLQAIRDSYFTFRGKDSFTSDDFRVQNWEEMKLNQYLYANGEVVKLWLYPRGPDSGFMVYPGEGNRYNFFDTTPLSHALGEPCYVVEPHPPGTQLIPNGLPVYTIYYENDDDSRREWGADSRLTFTAPTSGDYLVRVRDARGFGGEDYKYELTVRPREPDFGVRLNTPELTISPGTGQEFRIMAERYDGFEGPIEVELSGLPEGFAVTSPLVIEAGQIAAYGTVIAMPEATAPSDEELDGISITASALIGGKEVSRPVESFTKIEIGKAPKLLVQILPVEGIESHGSALFAAAQVQEQSHDGLPPEPADESLSQGDPLELTIKPGETIAARVRLVRRDFDGEVSLGGFDAGRNLPHGVYVDNIGLNGLTVLTGQTERVFFITADDWVPEQTRTFHLKANQAGNPTSQPVVLHVRP